MRNTYKHKSFDTKIAFPDKKFPLRYTYMIPVVLILLATLENVWPLIAGYAKTPPNMVFLGTIHHPGDYFYYLSQFAQGHNRWLTTLDLYTAEPIGPSFVGWTNVLMGKLGWLLHLNPQTTYGASVVLLTVLVFAASYRLIGTILMSRYSRFLALFLFAVFHAFPVIRDGAPSYGDYFNNYAIPRVRLGGVPHQLLLAIASIILTSYLLQWATAKKSSKKLIFVTGISAAILASLQPVLWLLILGVFGITAIVNTLLHCEKIKQLYTSITPIIFAFFCGTIPALYLVYLFSASPFSQLRQWEALQQTQLTLEHFLSASGPIVLIALASLPAYLTRPTYKNICSVLFVAFSILLFLSPIPETIGISHVRYMSTLTILFLSIIAADGLVKADRLAYTLYTGICDKKRSAPDGQTNKALPAFQNVSLPKMAVSACAIVLLTTYLLPNHLATISLASKFDLNNAFQYLSSSDYQFLLSAAGKSTNATDTFLLVWPYDVVFPGLTGKRSYNGHPLLTIDAPKKDTLASAFFDGSMTNNQMDAFLKTYGISYIIGYPWNLRLDSLPSVERIAGTDTLVLFYVKK